MGAATLGAAGVAALVLRRRPSPAAIERERRRAVNAAGRMVDGVILDVPREGIHYSYCVRGVEYTAFQEVAALRDRLPEDSAALVGPVTVKYLPAQPANSIVVCEEWSGLRFAARPPRRSAEEGGAAS